ncbi:hypothetical protein BOX15_Mlig016765g1 [Macrostomum lignano]|nr:hypothetical protein BOX15_Mlig016765g1 [Macrostomum lignano]
MSAMKVRTALSSCQEWAGLSAERLINGEMLTSVDFSQIVKRTVAILRLEPSLLELKSSVGCRVVGKLHGNLGDLLAIFRQYGWPSSTTYVFLGNYLYVNVQGQVQLNVLQMLLLFKIVYPNNIIVLRGLSECEHCAAEMGLMDVCCEQFSGYLYRDLVLLFKYLPLAALVGDVYFLSCSSLSLSRGFLIDYEVVDRPRTTCSQSSNRLSYLPNRLSTETLLRFQDWDRELEIEEYRNLRLFLQWNGLVAVVKTGDIDWIGQRCPTVEGPNSALISFHSSSKVDDRPVTGAIMIIHRNLCCTFHPVRISSSSELAVKILFPKPFDRTSKTDLTDRETDGEKPATR